MQHVHLHVLLVSLSGELQFVLRLAWFLGWWFWLVLVRVGLRCVVAVSVALLVFAYVLAHVRFGCLCAFDHCLLCTVIDCCRVCSYIAVSCQIWIRAFSPILCGP